MTITKYEHSCLAVSEQGRRLIIDPGNFASSLTDFSNVVGVVVTHTHFDHFNADTVRAIAAANPGIAVYGPAQVTAQLSELTTVTVNNGAGHEAGPFKLKFFGGTHALIHSSMKPDQNVGVLVNDSFYYAGDSFDKPDGPVDVLAVPAHAPWMKIAESMDYIIAIKPKKVFQIHDIFLSELGQQLADGRLQDVTEQTGGTYQHLKPGESIEI